MSRTDDLREVHVHEADGSDACMITKDEAAGLAGVTTRTIELWVSQGKITKFTVGPAGYWVRFCRAEILAAQEPVPVGTASASAGPG